MARLLGIIHMNPEVGMFSWRHDEVRFNDFIPRAVNFVSCKSTTNSSLFLADRPPANFLTTVQENKYGVGSVRDLSKFFTTFGIHVQLKRVEQHLCNFVASGQMHNSFAPFLREDNMGIDYNKIKFRFHELSAI